MTLQASHWALPSVVWVSAWCRPWGLFVVPSRQPLPFSLKCLLMSCHPAIFKTADFIFLSFRELAWVLCNYLDSTWEELTILVSIREAVVSLLVCQVRAACLYSRERGAFHFQTRIPRTDAYNFYTLYTPYTKCAKPIVCLLCLPCLRSPVSWSSSRAIWNVQRNGPSSQKGKRARCYHTWGCRRAAD